MNEELNTECAACERKVCHDGHNFCNEAMKENSFYKNERLYKGIKPSKKPSYAELEKQNEKLQKEVNEWKTKFEKLERKCRFNFTDLLEDVEKENRQEKQLKEAREIISEWEDSYCCGANYLYLGTKGEELKIKSQKFLDNKL